MAFWRGEIWNRRKNSEVYAEIISISAVRDEAGRLQHYIGVFSDIKRIKKHDDELVRFAHYDALTGVPNRRLFADRLGWRLPLPLFPGPIPPADPIESGKS